MLNEIHANQVQQSFESTTQGTKRRKTGTSFLHVKIVINCAKKMSESLRACEQTGLNEPV